MGELLQNAQGSTIYSETAAANYENAGIKGAFEMQIPDVPAKRLGSTEEVCHTLPFTFLPLKVIVIWKMQQVSLGIWSIKIPVPVASKDSFPEQVALEVC